MLLPISRLAYEVNDNKHQRARDGLSGRASGRPCDQADEHRADREERHAVREAELGGCMLGVKTMNPASFGACGSSAHVSRAR
jgi:hypothetical protein